MIRSDGGYGIRFVEPDDTLVRLVPVTEGTRMQIETFRDYFGFPQTVQFWTELRARVAAAAEAHEVTFAEGKPIRYVRGETIDDRNARWVQAPDLGHAPSADAGETRTHNKPQTQLGWRARPARRASAGSRWWRAP
ncbi:hypothetical protein JM654_06585 [Microbacterium oxydans]|nr:hypothetical protein [Microbacterium oxydans]